MDRFSGKLNRESGKVRSRAFTSGKRCSLGKFRVEPRFASLPRFEPEFKPEFVPEFVPRRLMPEFVPEFKPELVPRRLMPEFDPRCLLAPNGLSRCEPSDSGSLDFADDDVGFDMR